MDSYIGKEVTVNLEEFEPSGVEDYDYWGSIDDNGRQSGSGTITLSSRDYADEEEDIYGTVSAILSFTVDEGILTEIEPSSEYSACGDDGLGDGDPDEDWRQSDWNKAYRILDKMTKKAKVKGNE